MRKIFPFILIVSTFLCTSASASVLPKYKDTIPEITTSKPGDAFYVDGEKFINPDKEAYYRNPRNGWMNYFKSMIATKLADLDYGTCNVSFVVDEKGKVNNVKVVEMTNPALAKIVIGIIAKSPKWTPALFKGQPIKSYRIQPFSITQH